VHLVADDAQAWFFGRVQTRIHESTLDVLIQLWGVADTVRMSVYPIPLPHTSMPNRSPAQR
jgi:hypothetical protein